MDLTQLSIGTLTACWGALAFQLLRTKGGRSWNKLIDL